MTTPSWVQRAYVGQKVVCVSGWEQHSHIDQYPARGCVYTINEIVMAKSGECGRLLEEISNVPVSHPVDGFGDPSFRAWGFRPLTPVKQKLPESIRRCLDAKAPGRVEA